MLMICDDFAPVMRFRAQDIAKNMKMYQIYNFLSFLKKHAQHSQKPEYDDVVR